MGLIKRVFLPLVVFCILWCASSSLGQDSVKGATRVRLAMVNVPDEAVRPLIPEFNKQSGYEAVIVYTGNDPFAKAREGKADLVIAHYGHEGVEPFVCSGLGLWPHPVFANQMALLGPSSDPAHIRGLTDAAEAFRRIADAKAFFMINGSEGAEYLETILWMSAGRSPNGDWYLDPHSEGRAAVRTAAEKGAYILWGLPPFLRLKRQAPLALEPLVTGDSIFQRMMVSIVVNPKKTAGVNFEGADRFQSYLIAPATQAKIRAFRYPDFAQQAWWPAGRHNNARE
jgi:tungstate transport system substrate-binding protein